MGYNKRQFTKANDKKVLHKVRKHWVVISMALLMAIGGKAAATHVSANADTTNTNTLTNRVNQNLSQSKATLTNANQNANANNAKAQNNQSAHNITNQANVLHNRILRNANMSQNNNNQSNQGRKAVANNNVQNQANAPKINNHVNVNANQNPKLVQNPLAKSSNQNASSVNQKANKVDVSNRNSDQGAKLGAVEEVQNAPQVGDDDNQGDGLVDHINYRFIDVSDGDLEAGSMQSDEGYGDTPFDQSTVEGHLNDVPGGYDLVNSTTHDVIPNTDTFDQKKAAVVGNLPTQFTDAPQTIQIAVEHHKVTPSGKILVRYINEANGAEIDQTPLTAPGNSTFNQQSQYEHSMPNGFVFDKVLGYGNSTNGQTPTTFPAGKNIAWNIGVYMANPTSTYDNVKIQYQDHSDNDAVVGEENFSAPSGTGIPYDARFTQYLPAGYDYDSTDTGTVNNDSVVKNSDNGHTEVIYVNKNNVTPTPLSPLKGRSTINVYQVSDPNGDGSGTHIVNSYHLIGQTGTAANLAHYRTAPPAGYQRDAPGNIQGAVGQQLDNGVTVDPNESTNTALTFGKDYNGNNVNSINVAYEFKPISGHHPSSNQVNYQIVYKDVKSSDTVNTLNVKGLPGSKIDYAPFTQYLPDNPDAHKAYTFAGMGSHSGVVNQNDQDVIYVNTINTNAQGINVTYINKNNGQTVGTKNFAAGNYGSDVNVASDVPQGFTKVNGQQSDYAYSGNPQSVNYMVTGNTIDDAHAQTFNVTQKEYGHNGNYMTGHDQHPSFKIAGNVGDIITVNPDGTVDRNGSKDAALSSKFTYPHGFSTKNGDNADTLEIGLNGALVNKTNNLSSGTTPNSSASFDYSAQSNVGIPTNITAKFINQHGVQVGSSNVVQPMNASNHFSDGRYGQSVDVAKNNNGYGAADSAVPQGYSLLSGENTTYKFNSDANRTVNVYVNGNPVSPKSNPADPNGKTDTLKVNIETKGTQNGTPYDNFTQKYVQVPGNVGDTYVAHASDYQPSGYNANTSTQNIKIGNNGELTPNSVTFTYTATANQDNVAPMYLTYKDEQNGQVVGTPNMKITGNYNQTIDVTQSQPVPSHYTLTPHESTDYTFTDSPQNITVYVQGAAQPSPADPQGNVINVTYTLHNRHGVMHKSPEEGGGVLQVVKHYTVTGHHVADTIAVDPAKIGDIAVPDFHLKSGQNIQNSTVQDNGDVSNRNINYDLQENTGTVNIQYVNSDAGDSSVQSDESTGDVQSDFTHDVLPSYEGNRVPNGYSFANIKSGNDASYRNGKTIQLGLNQLATMTVNYVNKKNGKLVSSKTLNGNKGSSVNGNDLMDRLPGAGEYTLNDSDNELDPSNFSDTDPNVTSLPSQLENSTFTVYLKHQNVVPTPSPTPTNQGTINVFYYDSTNHKEVNEITLHGKNDGFFNYSNYEGPGVVNLPHNYDYVGPDTNAAADYHSMTGKSVNGTTNVAGPMYSNFQKGVTDNMIVDVKPTAGKNVNSDVTDIIQYENYDPGKADNGQVVGTPIDLTDVPGNETIDYKNDYNAYLPKGYHFVADASGNSAVTRDAASVGQDEVIYIAKDKQGNSLDPLTVDFYYNGTLLSGQSIHSVKLTGTPIDVGSYEKDAPAGYEATSLRAGGGIGYYSNDPSKQNIQINVKKAPKNYQYGYIHLLYVDSQTGNPVSNGDLTIDGTYNSLVDLSPYERNTPQGYVYNSIESGSDITTWTDGNSTDPNMPTIKIKVDHD